MLTWSLINHDKLSLTFLLFYIIEKGKAVLVELGLNNMGMRFHLKYKWWYFFWKFRNKFRRSLEINPTLFKDQFLKFSGVFWC